VDGLIRLGQPPNAGINVLQYTYVFGSVDLYHCQTPVGSIFALGPPMVLYHREFPPYSVLAGGPNIIQDPATFAPKLSNTARVQRLVSKSGSETQVDGGEVCPYIV